jgi:hypothetical protein
MGARFWIKRCLAVALGAFLLLLLAERLKGHGWREALAFSAAWALISASIFIGTRLYHSSHGQACAMCKDMPEEG